MTYTDNTYADNYDLRLNSADFEDVADAIDGLQYDTKTGWASVLDTWTYASASTITVPSGATALYQAGDKLWMTNSGTKYFYITSVASTTLTVTGGSDYTVANAAISSIYVSRADWPFGFPAHFNWTPTLTGFSADPTNTRYLFRIMHKYCIVDFRQTTSGTSNATTFTTTIPVAAATITNGGWGTILWQAYNNGAEISPPGRVFVVSAGTTATLQTTTASGAWTNVNGKMASFSGLAYPI